VFILAIFTLKLGRKCFDSRRNPFGNRLVHALKEGAYGRLEHNLTRDRDPPRGGPMLLFIPQGLIASFHPTWNATARWVRPDRFLYVFR
jgi:hypothetical protein